MLPSGRESYLLLSKIWMGFGIGWFYDVRLTGFAAPLTLSVQTYRMVLRGRIPFSSNLFGKFVSEEFLSTLIFRTQGTDERGFIDRAFP